ncbi:neutral zinc metallopeptidase [Parafrankia sp. CH37]|uniref:neutral zinc metallopeptidase n=1 Tax=Parafrankia sp. CH37 TaxID=683308 RepID=UPI00289C5A65|nr:neutral zinc metallopeptidase [Parafrankia sp. CH37]
MHARRAFVAAFTLSVLLLASWFGLSPGTTAAAWAETPRPACGGRISSTDDVVALITESADCPGSVNGYWRNQLGTAWTEPHYVPYRNGEIPKIACADGVTDPQVFADNALYCTLDDTIAYSTDFMSRLADDGGPSYPAFVVMHELGHRGDRIAGVLGAVSRAEENQADCLAGNQARFAVDAGRLTQDEAVNGTTLFYSLGDTRGGWLDQGGTAPDAHGTPAQRAQSFSLGYQQSIATCRTIGQSRDGNVPLI